MAVSMHVHHVPPRLDNRMNRTGHVYYRHKLTGHEPGVVSYLRGSTGRRDEAAMTGSLERLVRHCQDARDREVSSPHYPHLPLGCI
jgi:hypothetical protein